MVKESFKSFQYDTDNFFSIFHYVASGDSPELCSYFWETNMNADSEACNHFTMPLGFGSLGSNIHGVLPA